MLIISCALCRMTGDSILNAECARMAWPTSFVDNVILFDGRYIPAEVKLNVSTEPNITAQLERYCGFDTLFTNHGAKSSFPHEKLHAQKVILIDTQSLFIFSLHDKILTLVCRLDSLKRIDDLDSVKSKLNRLLKIESLKTKSTAQI